MSGRIVFTLSLMASLLGGPLSSHRQAVAEEALIAKDLQESFSSEALRAFATRSREAFSGDSSLYPYPRIILRKEIHFIKHAIQQRARALRAFLKDHHSGQKSYLSSHVIPLSVVQRALIRSGDFVFEGKIDSSQIYFVYGPDVVRASLNGQVGWYVLEDNVGTVGGLGDLLIAHNLMLKLHPRLAQAYAFADPVVFYHQLAQTLKRLAEQKGGIPVVYRSPGLDVDHDAKRFNGIMASLGVQTVFGKSKRKLVVEKDGLYLLSAGQRQPLSKQKVGALFINDELSWTDPAHPSMKAKYILDVARDYMALEQTSEELRHEFIQEIRDLKDHPETIDRILSLLRHERLVSSIKSPVPGLTEAILSGQVISSTTPGTTFVDDKEMIPYVEEMIRFYLQEEPLLHTPPVKSFIDPQTIETVFSNPDSWVIKRSDGRGGLLTWIGRETSGLDLQRVKKQILLDPMAYTVQAWLDVSRLKGRPTDLRLLTFVTPNSILIGDVPLGRVSASKSSLKVNLSTGGEVVSVLVTQDKSSSCERQF